MPRRLQLHTNKLDFHILENIESYERTLLSRFFLFGFSSFESAVENLTNRRRYLIGRSQIAIVFHLRKSQQTKQAENWIFSTNVDNFEGWILFFIPWGWRNKRRMYWTEMRRWDEEQWIEVFLAKWLILEAVLVSSGIGFWDWRDSLSLWPPLLVWYFVVLHYSHATRSTKCLCYYDHSV